MAEPQSTVYVVLRARELPDSTDTAWVEDGPHQTARSADQAVKQAAELRHENELDPNGVYIAVPARSWNPTPVKARTAFDLGGES